jgi:hypothetical protein
LTRNIGSRDLEGSAGKYRNREVTIADPPIDRVRRIPERKIFVGRPPERRGRASALRVEESEGPGGATACCESTRLCASVVSEPGTVCAFRAEEEGEDTLIHMTLRQCGIRARLESSLCSGNGEKHNRRCRPEERGNHLIGKTGMPGEEAGDHRIQ